MYELREDVRVDLMKNKINLAVVVTVGGRSEVSTVHGEG